MLFHLPQFTAQKSGFKELITVTKSNPHCLKPISLRHLTLLIKPHIYEGVVKMQTIGSLLKAERLKLRLTQKQMAAGVISTSFYSKVENDINDINAKDLISILELNSQY